MNSIHLNQIVMIIGTVLSIIVLMVGWTRRKTISGVYFIGFSLSVTWWLISGLVESFVTSQNAKILASQVTYLGFVQCFPYLFLFVITYIRQSKISPSIIIGIMIIPFLTIIAAWTNSMHGWLWSGYYWGSVKENVLAYQHGFWFWVHVVYLYSLLALGVFQLIKNIIIANRAFRSQLLIILAGIIFPVITGTMYIMGLEPVPGMDITPTGLVFTSMFLVWGLMKYQLLDLLPVARTALIEQLQDGVIVLDLRGRVVDINRTTQNLFGWDPKVTFGKDIAAISPGIADLAAPNDDQVIKEISLPISAGKIFEAQSSTLFDDKRQSIGKLMVLRDITARKHAESELHRAKELIEQTNHELEQALFREQHLAHTDELTGINNRRSLFELAEREFKIAARYKQALSVLMFDVDDFKLINDTFGHANGDDALKNITNTVCHNLRSTDIIGRYGGDEFVILLPQTSAAEAKIIAERIHMGVDAMQIDTQNGPLSLKISLGISQTDEFLEQNTGQTDSVENLFLRADQALYTAKQTGKNRAVVFGAINSGAHQ